MDFNDRFMKTTGRHFVTLSCIQDLPAKVGEKTPNEKLLLFSGFLVDVDDVWFYVTAGHILRRIRSALEGGLQFHTWRLSDRSAGNQFKNTAIPFLFEIDRWLVIEDEEVGLDYAATALHPMFRDLLAAGNVVAIEKVAWGDHVTDHDQWALVGVPSESVSYDGKTIITARIVVAPLAPVDKPPEAAGSRAENQFYGRLKDDSSSILKDVDGMSGGPIFSLKNVNGQWKYHVIGLQSSWYPSSRVIAACPFSSFGLALEDIVAEARAAVDGRNQ